MRAWYAPIVLGLVTTSACFLHAPVSRPRSSPLTTTAATDASPRARASDELVVRNVRLQPVLLPDGDPAWNLTFDLQNTSPKSVADVILRVSFLAPGSHEAGEGTSAPVGGPMTIRSKTVLLAGFMMKYEMTLRNVSSAADCQAAVDVVSARWLDMPQPMQEPRAR